MRSGYISAEKVTKTTHIDSEVSGRIAPVLVFTVAFIVFLIALSRWYDLNGLVELYAIDSASWQSWLVARPMLFRPLAYAFVQAWRLLGYQGLSVLPTQVLSALCGAIGLALMWKVLVEVCSDRKIATWLTIAFGGSYSYWYYSTDVHYIMVAEVFVLLGLYCLLRLRDDPSNSSLIAAMVASTTLAIGFWEADVLLLFPFAVGLIVLPRRFPLRDRLKVLARWGISTLLLTAVLFGGIGYFVFDTQTPSDWLSWLTRYSTHPRSIHNVFDLKRYAQSAIWGIGAILPIWNGLGLRALLQGEIIPQKLIPQLSLALSAVLGLGVAGQFVRRYRSWAREHWSFFVFVLSWVLPFVAFIVWWEPFQPR